TLWPMQEQVQERFDKGLDHIRASPAETGRLELIVRRPAEGEREILDEAYLDLVVGLVGDRWADRLPGSTPIYLQAQLTGISTRVLGTIEPDSERWPLAGEQLFVDLDLSVENLPPGSRLGIGSAVLEVSEEPHTGCAKFSA